MCKLTGVKLSLKFFSWAVDQWLNGHRWRPKENGSHWLVFDTHPHIRKTYTCVCCVFTCALRLTCQIVICVFHRFQSVQIFIRVLEFVCYCVCFEWNKRPWKRSHMATTTESAPVYYPNVLVTSLVVSITNNNNK